MRLGSTSYIYPADIITNVRRLAGKIRDVELLIFECDEDGTNLPDGGTMDELVRLGIAHDMSFTVHLPLDLRLAGPEPGIDRASIVIRCTEALNPAGYIVHLDGDVSGAGLEPQTWIERSLESLERLCHFVSDPARLCVENLDDRPPELMDDLLKLTAVSCCVDVGHLWKQGRDPLPWLSRWLPRTRVVHLHGVGTRDHHGLSLMPHEKLDPVVDLLVRHFNGVVTFEVFNEADLLDCMEAFQHAVRRPRKGRLESLPHKSKGFHSRP